jgi:hypothetical protein
VKRDTREHTRVPRDGGPFHTSLRNVLQDADR